jgi:LysR family transcriptional regulator, hydrogen peroxide-inducible genes activator
MEIHQLVYFVAVAETGGFSRAAERCHVAQPSLSQQIIRLEQELGQQLFDRLGRKVALTQAGSALLPRARLILAEMQEAKRSLQQEGAPGYGALAVGFIPTIAPFILPAVIKHFSQAFPDVILSVYEDFTDSLVRDLIGGRLDIGIMSLPVNNRLIQTEELLSEPLLVGFSRQNKLLTRAAIQVKELESFPFIALSEVHCLGEQVQAFCAQRELDLDIVCHTAQLSTLQNCLALGLGVSLVPQALAASDASEQVSYQSLSDVSPQRKIAAAYHSGRLQSHLAREFISMVREEYLHLLGAYQTASPG